VVERIADPLMHLVRNALDHGLEPPEQRMAAGKPAQGRLVLSAWHEAGSILIRIQDDGRGIQRQKVLAARLGARPGRARRGAARRRHPALIFEPGFSTAEKVTNLSGPRRGHGRGARNIEALRGTVQTVHSPGQGSRIEIRLPLTLAIIDGFLVGVGSIRASSSRWSGGRGDRGAAPTVDAARRRGRSVRGTARPGAAGGRACAPCTPGRRGHERVSVVVVQAGSRALWRAWSTPCWASTRP
jgi:two-component system chemotaxis sensor kinase CheA